MMFGGGFAQKMIEIIEEQFLNYSCMSCSLAWTVW